MADNYREKFIDEKRSNFLVNQTQEMGDMSVEMNNLSKYLLTIPAETVWMHFFAYGCAECPAKEFCDRQPEGTCCRENFSAWAGEKIPNRRP